MFFTLEEGRDDRSEECRYAKPMTLPVPLYAKKLEKEM